MIRRFGIVVSGVALATLFYLLLIDSADVPELLVLPAVALLAGGAFVISGEEGLTEAAIAPLWLPAVWRPLSRVVPDTVLLVRALLSQLRAPRARRGQLRSAAFPAGRSSADVGRIALTESLGSLAPNTIVIGVDPERELLLVHQLQRQGGDADLDPLRLR